MWRRSDAQMASTLKLRTAGSSQMAILCASLASTLRRTRSPLRLWTSSSAHLKAGSSSSAVARSSLASSSHGTLTALLITGTSRGSFLPSLRPKALTSRSRLDLGFDDTAFKIQRKALEQLVYDPVRQAHDSARAVHALQEIWRSAQGQVPPADIREISRRGTSLRELIVPSSQDEAAVDEPQEHQQSALFTNDQLINSWVRRYEREQPLVMPGDPDLGLNASQLRAIACALSDRLSLIQGVRDAPQCLQPLSLTLDCAATRDRQESNDCGTDQAS